MQRRGHRLLQIDVLLRPQGHHRRRGVHVVRRADRHGVELVRVTGEHLAPILVPRCLGIGLGRRSQRPLIHIAQRDDLHLGMAGDALHRAAAHAATPMQATCSMRIRRGARQNRRTAEATLAPAAALCARKRRRLSADLLVRDVCVGFMDLSGFEVLIEKCQHDRPQVLFLRLQMKRMRRAFDDLQADVRRRASSAPRRATPIERRARSCRPCRA